ncbi:MAG: phosphorelay protein LuxU [Alphaproteobacteria bacterium]|nr:phosphorelay protein LuxU [Alphaproteobacteria bacterium]
MVSGGGSIDWKALDQLTAEVGLDVLPRLLRTFYGEAEKRLGTFARLSGDAPELGEGLPLHREIHSLKSAAASFGASGLATRAAEIEAQIESRAYRHDPAVVAELAGLFAEFRSAVARRGVVVD